jgi:hypothetical protein
MAYLRVGAVAGTAVDAEPSLKLFLEYCATDRDEFSNTGLGTYLKFRCLRSFPLGKCHPSTDPRDLIAQDYETIPYSGQDLPEFVQGLSERGVKMIPV